MSTQLVSLLLGESGDPVLQRVADRLGTDVVWVTPEDLVYRIVIDDEIDRGGSCTIRWLLPGMSEPITNSSVVGVLNRIGELSPSLFESIQPDDREYALAEFTAYLHFALSCFTNVINPAWVGTTSGYCQSLPYQWSVASIHKLTVPKFYFGQKDRAPESFLRSHRFIFSENPLNPLWWTTIRDSHLASVSPRHGLCYLRPVGDALVAIVIDEDVYTTDLLSRRPTNISGTVSDSLVEIARHFHLRYGSALLFRNRDGDITFGSMIADVDIGQHAPEYAEQMIEKLAKIVSVR